MKLWATFNEANVMAFCGWLYGSFPPGRLLQFETCGRVLLHCLRAHAAAYAAIKALPGECCVCACCAFVCAARVCCASVPFARVCMVCRVMHT